MSNYKEGQVNQLMNALEKEGVTSQDLTKLGQSAVLIRDTLQLIRGSAEINIIKHIIDYSADPFIPDGWSVEEHNKCEKEFEWNPEKFEFYLSKGQQNGKCIGGNKLRKELKNKPILNANVLDYLIKNPHLIPEEWKKDENGNTRYIFFWGTIYRRSDGDLCVRYLDWRAGEWRWSYRWLVDGWFGVNPALLLAS